MEAKNRKIEKRSVKRVARRHEDIAVVSLSVKKATQSNRVAIFNILVSSVFPKRQTPNPPHFWSRLWSQQLSLNTHLFYERMKAGLISKWCRTFTFCRLQINEKKKKKKNRKPSHTKFVLLEGLSILYTYKIHIKHI